MEREKDRSEYELLMELEHLESLKEELEELGIRSIEELEARIRVLHARLDQETG